MRKTFQFASWIGAVLTLVLVAGLAGCGGKPAVKAPELLELSEPERTAALAQRVCPVDGELLGMPGTPVKVNVKNQEVFVCSAACEDTLRTNPQRYLQVIEAAKTE